MRHTPKVLTLLVALLACAAFTREARADALAVTGGFANARDTSGGTFTLVGNNFTLSGGTYQGTNSFPARAGRTVSLGTFNLGLDIAGGQAVAGGVSYGNVVYQGFLRFSASYVLPADAPSEFTVVVPFTLTGHLQACTDPLGAISFCPAGSIAFESDLSGQGLATAILSSFVGADGVRVYSLRSVRYDFNTPTPEPATMILLASGLAGAAGAARRRRRSGRHP